MLAPFIAEQAPSATRRDGVGRSLYGLYGRVRLSKSLPYGVMSKSHIAREEGDMNDIILIGLALAFFAATVAYAAACERL